jgi:hypothetical protein
MQMLASAACKCWHQQHANVGISSMQMLPNNGYMDDVRRIGSSSSSSSIRDCRNGYMDSVWNWIGSRSAQEVDGMPNRTMVV